MFNAAKVLTRLNTVDDAKQLLQLLADSIGYTYGDRFSVGNYKLGSSSVQPDEQHPDWEWQPIAGALYSIASCQVEANDPVIIFVTGTRGGDRSKSVLCIWSSDVSGRTQLATKLAETDGNGTIGSKLAELLGYSDWAIVAGPSTSQANVYTYVNVTAAGITPGTNGWISPVALTLPDDGEHVYTTTYDPYSGLMLLDPSSALPTMLVWFYNPSLQSASLVMAKSAYDADHQNTVDIVHYALADRLDVLIKDVGGVSDDITGLVAANGALFGAIQTMPVFGSKFVDVVNAWERIEDSSQYIPRP